VGQFPGQNGSKTARGSRPAWASDTLARTLACGFYLCPHKPGARAQLPNTTHTDSTAISPMIVLCHASLAASPSRISGTNKRRQGTGRWQVPTHSAIRTRGEPFLAQKVALGGNALRKITFQRHELAGHCGAGGGPAPRSLDSLALCSRDGRRRKLGSLQSVAQFVRGFP